VTFGDGKRAMGDGSKGGVGEVSLERKGNEENMMI
jgi:hypothetical protein